MERYFSGLARGLGRILRCWVPVAIPASRSALPPLPTILAFASLAARQPSRGHSKRPDAGRGRPIVANIDGCSAATRCDGWLRPDDQMIADLVAAGRPHFVGAGTEIGEFIKLDAKWRRDPANST